MTEGINSRRAPTPADSETQLVTLSEYHGAATCLSLDVANHFAVMSQEVV